MTETQHSGADTADFFDPDHQQPLDWDKLERWLAGQGKSLARDPAPRQFTGGFGNLNFLVVVDGMECVLRRPPVGPLPPGGNDMAREYKVISGLNRAFPLAPLAIAFCDDPDVLGAPFFIMEYRDGLVVRDEIPPPLQGKGRELSRMLVEVLDRFQQVDPKEVGLDDLGKPEGFLDRAVAGWSKRFGVAAADVYTKRDQPLPKSATAVMEWLAAQPTPAGAVTLLHNDYKLNNVILDRDDPIRPIGLLDWDMSTRGDPLFDFATLMSYWIEPDDPSAMHEMGQMPSAKDPTWIGRRELAELYGEITGRDLSDLHFYRVLTAFKLGVIFLQIYARYCRGRSGGGLVD